MILFEYGPEPKDELRKSVEIHEIEARNAGSKERKKGSWPNGEWDGSMSADESAEALMVHNRQTQEWRRKMLICCWMLNSLCKEKRAKFAHWPWCGRQRTRDD